MSKEIRGTIDWATLAKPFFVSGFVVTLLIFPAYAFDRWHTIPVWGWALLLVFAPIINGGISVLSMSVGYPVYYWLARRKVLKFDVVAVRADVDPDSKLSGNGPTSN